MAGRPPMARPVRLAQVHRASSSRISIRSHFGKPEDGHSSARSRGGKDSPRKEDQEVADRGAAKLATRGIVKRGWISRRSGWSRIAGLLDVDQHVEDRHSHDRQEGRQEDQERDPGAVDERDRVETSAESHDSLRRRQIRSGRPFRSNPNGIDEDRLTDSHLLAHRFHPRMSPGVEIIELDDQRLL